MDRLRRLVIRLVPYGLTLLVGGLTALALYGYVERQRGGGALVFHRPGALVLLAACLLLAWVGFELHVQRSATFTFSRVGDLARTRRGFVSWLSSLPRVLRVVALALLAVALARPQTFKRQDIEVEGIDIMLVLDLSKSMEERDLARNRLDAAQRTIRRFLTGRTNDRLGLVVFAREAMLQCPLTLDYASLDSIVANLEIGDLEPMGTAIGDGVGLAIGSLRRSDAKSKVVILLTDGDSNIVNEMSPDEAITMAKERDIRIFTVLVGQEAGQGPRPIDLLGRQSYGVNPDLLRRMAAETSGRYFHAGDTRALDQGFEEVRATREKSKRREIGKVYGELFPAFVAPGALLLLLEIMLSLTRLRKFP